MHHIITWKWNQAGFRHAYTAEHVNRLADAIRVNLHGKEHRLLCVTDESSGIKIDTFPLWNNFEKMSNQSGKHLPSCYRRLRLFDPVMQHEMGIRKGDRIISIDLDTLVTGPLEEIIMRKDRFVGWAVRGHYHPRVFNGSYWAFNASDLTHMWSEFNPEMSPTVTLKAGFYGSDQSWLSYKLAREPYTYGLTWPQVCSYPREVRVQRTLDRRARLIMFHGQRKPWHDEVQKESPWVNRYYKMELT